MIDRFSLRGKPALVTGASRGIGKAIAVAFAEAEAELILLGSSSMRETMIPTGGVTMNNVTDYLSAGAIAVGMGGP